MFKIIFTIVLAGLCLQLVSADSFAQECLEKHNEYRARHSSPPLQLDPTLQAYAQEWANYMAATNLLGHRHNNVYGENIHAMLLSHPGYNEIEVYDWNNQGFSTETGHFTQVVWGGSKKLGCAKAKSGSTTYVVANYDPPGNYEDEFEQNVLRN